MTSRPASPGADGSAAGALVPVTVAVFLVACGCTAVLFAVGVGNPSGSAAPQPLVITALQNGPVYLPAGPVLNLTMRSTASIPIVNLSVQIRIEYGGSSYQWVDLVGPIVSTASPLLPNQSISAMAEIFSGNATCGAVYSVRISGIYSTGSTFGFVASHVLDCVRLSTLG